VTRVLLFAKAPRAGLVKTRLARDVGEERALAVYRTVGQGVAAAMAAYPLTVWYDPPDALQEMREWLGDHEYRVQEGEDLGGRMALAFREHFARGDGPVVVIGADTPHLSATTIADAIRVLDQADVVIGPALDGGYYLLGLKALHAPLFEGVPWGTSNVLQVTVGRCQDLDLTVGQLGVRRDIDTVEDLRALGM